LDFGLAMHYLRHEFTGRWHNVDAIIQRVSPLIDPLDAYHIKQILTEGCPAEFDFEGEHENNMLFLEQGNEPSVDQKQAVVQKNSMRKKVPTISSHYLGGLFLCMCTSCATVNDGQTWK